ncbi:MAG TPA: VOC family protein [Planctomycetota bacterium]|nr:VOC family protein [Planctomycetota bacterium]
MKCLRLAHVNVRVDRLEPAVRFYGGVLGLERIPRAEAENRGAWFRLGTAEIHVAEDPAPQPPSKRHFAVEVDDLPAARKAVLDGGAPLEKEEPGRFWTRDPAGNRIEIVQARV